MSATPVDSVPASAAAKLRFAVAGLDRHIASAWAVVALALVASMGLALQPAAHLPDPPISEDAFYDFTVARNLALGHGPTVAGHLTNGFQPLYTILLTPIFWLTGGDRWLGIRLALLLETAILASTACLVGLIARDLWPSASPALRRHTRWLASALYPAAGFVFEEHENGLETGCLLLVIAITWRTYQLVSLDRPRRVALIGVLAGLLVLARVDAVVLVLLLALITARRWSSKSAAAILVMSAVPGMAWLAYGRLWVGSLIPTSGRAELSLGLTATKLTQAGAALGRAALPWLSVPGIDGAVADGARFGLVVLILAALAWRLRHSPVRLTEWVAGSDDVGARGAEFGGCIALSTLLLLSFYTLTSGATYFYARYAAPLALVVTVLAALPTARFLQAIPRSLAPLLLITTVPVVAAVMLTYLGQPLARSPFDHDQLAMVEKYVPRGATVAAFNSGTLGYFWDHTINLDGKVNVDALHARGHRLQYIERLRVRWLCDYQTFPSRLFILPGQSRHWRLVARSGQFILLHRDPY